MIDFNPSEEERAELCRKVENDETESTGWDFVNEGTDALRALDLAEQIARAERDERRFLCVIVGKEDEQILVLEPAD